MKKTLLFVAMTVLILNATGCGACRNGLFARRAAAAPMMGHMQCAPVCQPVCCPQPCDPCCSGGMSSGGMSSVGYDGGAMMMPEMDGGGCACGQ